MPILIPVCVVSLLIQPPSFKRFRIKCIHSDSRRIYFSEHKHSVSPNPITFPVHISKTVTSCVVVGLTRIGFSVRSTYVYSEDILF